MVYWCFVCVIVWMKLESAGDLGKRMNERGEREGRSEGWEIAAALLLCWMVGCGFGKGDLEKGETGNEFF